MLVCLLHWSPSYLFIFAGKHRKHPGGRGLAGSKTHHRTYMDRFHPGHFGKLGMRYFHMTRNQFHRPIVNVEKLWTMVSDEERIKHAKETDKVPVIDTLAAGFGKVLGKGNLPSQAVIVKARFFSKFAEKKIKAAGGTCVLVK